MVDTITTDEEGKAETKELYLGKYQIVEKTAPDGLVLNTETHEVELTYAGQEVSVTEADTAFCYEVTFCQEVNAVFNKLFLDHHICVICQHLKGALI